MVMNWKISRIFFLHPIKYKIDEVFIYETLVMFVDLACHPDIDIKDNILSARQSMPSALEQVGNCFLLKQCLSLCYILDCSLDDFNFE